ncbi:penicillin-binding protein activator [Shewanella marina]|uniref:penicillin-binding protein activator n=1 Tax=Shewanella marina TaxID=487319 RepID=UPI00046F6EFA|nr:penicillin-binding protein activator [Shewanella marina]
MLKSLNTTKLIPLALLSTILVGCATSTPDTSSLEPVSLISAPMAASHYLALAAQAPKGSRHDSYLLLAAHAYLNQGNHAKALEILNAMRATMTQSPKLLAEHQFLEAKAMTANQQYDTALQVLNYPTDWQLPDWQLAAYHQLKASLYQLIQRPVEQAQQLSLLSQYLPREQAKTVNDQIWKIVYPMPEHILAHYMQDTSQPIFAGWMQLAYIAKHYAVDPAELVRYLAQWQQQNPSHPAAIALPTDLEKALNAKPYNAKHIAVLLPLTGNMAKVAAPVDQGLAAAYLANHDQDATVNFYDTSKGAVQAYQQAVTAGADFIIGPLLPNNVEQVAEFVAQQPSSVPQLFLNQPKQILANDHSFYFALSPVQEALEAAKKLYSDGIKLPLILASNDATSKRMAQSFSDEWQQLTGKPAEVHYYDAGDKMKLAVREALDVTDSLARIKAMKALIGNKTQADFRSRRDIDAIYMIAPSRDLPLLKPFIDVSFSVFAQPVPLYTSSRGRPDSMNQETAQELNKLNISDSPWLMQASADSQQLKQLWPTWGNNQKRLFIMGYDAIDLINSLAQMRAFPGYQFHGRSGDLSVNPEGVIERQLSWGQYQNGSLVNQ